MLRVFYKSAFFKSLAHCQRHLEYLDKQGPLFDGKHEVSLHQAREAAEQFADAPKWWFVYSLDRDDQQRLQVDRGYFQDLMEAQKALWAKAYNIPPDRLHICASFHDVAHHPHIHVVLHGETASDGFIVQRKGQTLGEAFCRCRETVKSAITNEIYREDTQHLKVEKNEQRKNMNQELGKILLDIGAAEGIFTLNAIEQISHAYLFECDEEWIEALEATFAPWKEKITIVRKYVSDTDEGDYITLDRYFQETTSGKRFFLKMDIEGYERKALKGAQQLLKQADVSGAVCLYHRKDDKEVIQKICAENGFETSIRPNFLYIENEMRPGVLNFYREKK